MASNLKLYFLTPKPVFGGVKPGKLFEHLGIPEPKAPESQIVPVRELEALLPESQRVDANGNPFVFQYQADVINSGPYKGFGAHLMKWKKDKEGNPLSTLEDFQHCVQIDRKDDGTWFINHDFVRKLEGAGCESGVGTPGAITVPVLYMEHPGRAKEYWLVFNLVYRTKILDLSALPKKQYGMWTLDFPGGFGDIAGTDAAKRNAQAELLEEMGMEIGASKIIPTGYGIPNRTDTANGNYENLVLVNVESVSKMDFAPVGDMIHKNARIAIPLKLCFNYVDQKVNSAILATIYTLSALDGMLGEEREKILNNEA